MKTISHASKTRFALVTSLVNKAINESGAKTRKQAVTSVIHELRNKALNEVLNASVKVFAIGGYFGPRCVFDEKSKSFTIEKGYRYSSFKSETPGVVVERIHNRIENTSPESKETVEVVLDDITESALYFGTNHRNNLRLILALPFLVEQAFKLGGKTIEFRDPRFLVDFDEYDPSLDQCLVKTHWGHDLKVDDLPEEALALVDAEMAKLDEILKRQLSLAKMDLSPC